MPINDTITAQAASSLSLMYITRNLWRLALALLALGALAPAGAAYDGARLYAANCAACHGSNGTGGVGVPIALPDFLAQAGDDYLRKTIRLGRPGRVMPAFTKLSDAEVNAIVRHLRSWQTVPAAPVPRVGRGDAGNGARLYASHCASCHGAHGEGGHGTGVTFSRPRDLPVLPPALNNPGFLAAAPDAMIKAVLEHGRANTPMTSFRKAGLSDRNLDDLVAHVRSLGKTGADAGVKPAKDEPAVLTRISNNGMKDTLDRLKGAIAGANMTLIRVAPFDEGIAEKGRENPQRMAVDACDFTLVNQALSIDPRIGLFLPCRITLVEEAGKVRVMAINPKRLSALFNNAELDDLCEKMHAVYVEILEESTL